MACGTEKTLISEGKQFSVSVSKHHRLQFLTRIHSRCKLVKYSRAHIIYVCVQARLLKNTIVCDVDDGFLGSNKWNDIISLIKMREILTTKAGQLTAS